LVIAGYLKDDYIGCGAKSGLGLAQHALGYRDLARAMHSEVLELCETNKWLNREALARLNLARVLIESAEFDPALRHLARAWEIMNEEEDDVGRAWCDLWTGTLYERMGMYADARVKTRMALEVMERSENGSGMASALFELGILAQKTNVETAWEYFQRSMEIRYELGEIGNAVDAIERLLPELEHRRQDGSTERLLDSIGVWREQHSVPRSLTQEAFVEAIFDRGRTAMCSGTWHQSLPEIVDIVRSQLDLPA
jgi:tetratricopeptide (TPR) repeat protein